MVTLGSGTALAVRPRTISPIPAGSRILDDARLDTIAGSLLRIFVRMGKLDASLGALSRRQQQGNALAAVHPERRECE